MLRALIVQLTYFEKQQKTKTTKKSNKNYLYMYVEQTLLKRTKRKRLVCNTLSILKKEQMDPKTTV